jgi:hypothetical protein
VLRQADELLWAALATWGIRLTTGTIDQHVRALAAAPSVPREEEDEPDLDVAAWHPALPPAPEEFPSFMSLDLPGEEARFLALLLNDPEARDPAAARRRDSLLAAMVADEWLPERETFWGRRPPRSASPALRESIHHAGCFSDVVDGARVLYAREVALGRDDDLAAAAERRLAEWARRVERRIDELTSWEHDLGRFWRLPELHHITWPEQSFVAQWARLALTLPSAVAFSEEARVLIRDREAAVKTVRARLAPSGKQRPAVPVPDRLTFRWFEGRSIATDICEGLRR